MERSRDLEERIGSLVFSARYSPDRITTQELLAMAVAVAQDRAAYSDRLLMTADMSKDCDDVMI